MPTTKTLTGKPFTYSGSLATGLTVQFGNAGKVMKIPDRIIDFIRTEITRRSPVLAGANPRSARAEFGRQGSSRETSFLAASDELRIATISSRRVLHC